MAVLSVNVNKIATLRNSRGGNNPDVLQTVLDIIGFGAEGITVHPRPDERHIRQSDVYEISQNIDVEFNIEGYPSDDFIEMVREVRPAQCTLVPDPPHVITSNAGWKVKENFELLKKVVSQLKSANVRVSLFYDPYDYDQDDLVAVKQEIGADRIELYTEGYAKAFGTDRQEEVMAVYQRAAQGAVAVGLEVNAGHDLDLDNLPTFLRAIPEVKEVSIGHALVCDALYMGLEKSVQAYLQASKN